MKLLGDLNKNARVSLIAMPFWSLFWVLVYFYSPLYMRSLGLDEIAIGTVNTVALAGGFLCHLIASPIANRLGRKRATLIFDLLSWSVPMLIWAVSKNVWFFLAAGIINAFSKVTVISWNCLISEDEQKPKVSKIYTILSLLNSSMGVFAPISGFFIVRFGLVVSMRALYAIGALSMAVMFIIRNFFVVETEAGKKLMNEHKAYTIGKSIGAYLKMVLGLHKNKGFVLLSVIFVATNFVTTLNIFQVIFLSERLFFPAKALSLIPFTVAVANVALYFFAVPHLGKKRSESALNFFIACNLAASVLFLIIPEKNLMVMLAVMAANGMSNFLLQAYRESVFMNNQGNHEKADMYSAVQTVTILCCIPAGYLGGLLYKTEPLLPFALVSVLYLIALLASLAFSKGKYLRKGETGPSA